MVLLVMISWVGAVRAAAIEHEFAVRAKDMILRPRHLYNFSGAMTVRPDINQFGFCDSFSPPFFANPLAAIWKLDDRLILVSDYLWRPSGTLLTGKTENGVWPSLQIVPLPGRRAFICKLVLVNKSQTPLQKTLTFEMDGKVGKTENWGWVPPSAEGSDTAVSFGDKALVLASTEAQLAAVFEPSPTSFRDGKTACFTINLPPGRRQRILAVVVLANPQGAVRTANSLLGDAENQIAEAQHVWDHKFETLQDRLPRLITQDDKLQQFYQRSLLTFLNAQWDLEGFAFAPWYAESGIDGGAVCNYLWGDAYISRFLPLADPAFARFLLMTSMKADYGTHYAIGPLTGDGLGVGYSYNYTSMALLVYDYITITGDKELLAETIRGKPFLDALWEYVFEREDLTAPPELIDYGTNENLLELGRTRAYQHYTPSPNLERLLIYRMMDQLYRLAGRKTSVDLADRADRLRQVLLSELWDEDLKWFRCLDQNRNPQICWSIQIFDMLRAEVLSPEQAAGLVGHLNEKEFLSEWGAHSLSKQDPGYDPSDVDWGGPGVYAGDGPQLAEDLLGAGFAGQGIDLLRRILWWGQFPYIPQAVRADSRDYRHDGRANVIAALAGPQAIVWGLFGIRADPEKITINPVEHPYTAGMGVENLKIRGRIIKIMIDADGRNYTVDADGQVTRNRIGNPYILKFK